MKHINHPILFGLTFLSTFVAGARALGMGTAPATTIQQVIHCERETIAETLPELYSDAELRDVLASVQDFASGLEPDEWEPEDLAVALAGTYYPDAEVTDVGDPEFDYEYVEDETGVIQMICRKIHLITLVLEPGDVAILIEIVRWM